MYDLSEKRKFARGTSIVHKYLALVAVPLVFEVFFVFLVMHIHRQTELSTKQMNDTRQLSELSNALVLDLYDVGNWTNDDVPPKIVLKNYLARITARIAKLERLANNDPQQTMLLNDTHRGLKGLATLLSQMPAADRIPLHYAINFNGQARDFSQVRRQLLFQVASPSFLKLIGEQQEIERRHSLALAEYRRQTRVILVLGTVASIILTVFLVYFISRNLIRRLHLLQEKTAFLERGGKSDVAVPGNDEITFLDQAFRDMAQSLSASRNRERAILENAADLVCSLDDNGCFLTVSPASIRLLGFQPHELIGKSLVSLLHEGENDIRTQLRKILTQADDAINQTTSLELSVRHRDGHTVYFSISARRSTTGQLTACVMRDVTAENEVARMKQEVTSAVTGELQAPLKSLATFLETVSARPSDANVLSELSVDGESLLGAAKRSNERMLTLTEDLVDLERYGSGQKPPFIVACSLLDILAKSLDAVAAVAHQKDVLVEVETANAFVEGDAEQLARVFVNLLSNALKFAPQHSRIDVTTSCDNELVTVCVSDQGPGIEEKMVDVIFEPFQQIAFIGGKKRGGTGLGLAICKAIVESHAGSIKVESQIGRGSTFLVTLPAAGGRFSINAKPSVSTREGGL